MSNAEKERNSNASSSLNNFDTFEDDFSERGNEDETIPAGSLSKETAAWDAFVYSPPKNESASMQKNEWLDGSARVIKAILYCVIFCTAICSSLIAKCAVLFSVAQLDEKHYVKYCDDCSECSQNTNAKISKEGRTVWTWYIIFMFLVPECINILCSIWNAIFKKTEVPTKRRRFILFLLETLHPIGLALLVFYCLPKMNSVDAAAVCSCICFVPALLNLFSVNRSYRGSQKMLRLLFNFLALISQGSGIALYSILYYDYDHSLAWIFPTSLLLSSCRWWTNYVSIDSYCGFIRVLATVKMDSKNSPYLLQAFIACWRCSIFILSAMVISMFKGIQVHEFFEFFRGSNNTYNVELFDIPNYLILANESKSYFQTESISVPSNIFLIIIQFFCAFITYQAAIFTYKTQMHKFSLALPITLTTPGAIFLVLMFSVIRKQNACSFHNIIPNYLFFDMPNYNSIKDFLISWRLCWIILWMSQIWITIQLWLGENECLALTEKIFYNSAYDSLMIDQFLSLNKRKHETYNVINEEKDMKEDTFETDSLKETRFTGTNSTFSKEPVTNKKNTQIYACVTMWHEKKEEMKELIGSILRLDKECTKDYYELETHIFFDDAFCCMHCSSRSCEHNENEMKMNQHVLTFVETMKENLKIFSSPIKYPTPYGGQLVWILPETTRLTLHLKDSNKIRHRKRWSQVMYMYYLLGYRLMGSSLDDEQKELVAENTYILTLDGDIDFQPTAVKSLIDFMKKDKDLSAACGRIHPVGKGLMIWCQTFEYAIGHWLQKSTEHITGSVLCSPGCFSLYRAKALLQHNVLAKYTTTATEPRHFIQYDQGEDRWLCTLILQTGGRVEYCAASDAYTHAPESFKEFFVQRRRWIPSTIANVFDLLNTSKETRKLNNSISWLYIFYQTLLTGSTIIGPSFIYLMMVGAFVECFHIDNWSSFWYNMIPITIFIIISLIFNERIQLITAEILTVIYSLIMIVVLVGMVLQVAIQGSFAPNTLLFFIVLGQFLLTGFMHPQEWTCLKNGIIYYITVPSMYMLLIIFSICNVHNVTWGTRESKVSEMKQTNNKASQLKEKIRNNWTNFSLGHAFRCVIGSQKDTEETEKYLKGIFSAINDINIRLEQIERNYASTNVIKEDAEEDLDEENETDMKDVEVQVTEDNLEENTDSESEVSVKTSISSYPKYSKYLVNPHWLQEECIQAGQVDFLSTVEEEFWKQLIEKYLHPIENDTEKQESIKKKLMNMRNEYLLKFFTLNILFVVAIFLLQINKEVLYIQWPFAVSYNISYSNETDEIHVLKDYMHLEPIGCVFIVAFVLILCIQFSAMCVHQFNTFTHILANVKVCGNRIQKRSSLIITNEYMNNVAEDPQNTIQNERRIQDITSYSKEKENNREVIKDTRNSQILFPKTLSEPKNSGLSKISSRALEDTIEVLESPRSKILAKDEKSQLRNKTYSNTNEVSNINSKKRSKDETIYEYTNPTFLNDNDT